jgi:hypothetical protein
MQRFGKVSSPTTLRIFGISVHGPAITYFPFFIRFPLIGRKGLFQDDDMWYLLDSIACKCLSLQVLQHSGSVVWYRGGVKRVRVNPEGSALKFQPSGFESKDFGKIKMMRGAGVMAKD